MKIKDQKDILDGLIIIQDLIDKNEISNIFINMDSVSSVVDFLQEYVITHKVEINKSLDRVSNV